MLVLQDRLHRMAEITVQGILADSERPTEAEELTLIRRTSVDKVRLIRGKPFEIWSRVYSVTGWNYNYTQNMYLWIFFR